MAAVNGCALGVPLGGVCGGSHRYRQVGRNIENADFVEQPVRVPRLLDNLFQGLSGDNGSAVGQGVETVRTLFCLRCGIGTVFRVGQVFAQQLLEKGAAVFRGGMGVCGGLCRVQHGAFDGVKIGHGVSFLSGSRLYIGLWICCPVYNADFVNRCNLCNGAFPLLLVKGVLCHIKGKGHLGQIAPLDGFIYAAPLLCVGQFGPHFKPGVCHRQCQGFGASGKGNACAVMVDKQGDIGKVYTVKGISCNILCVAAHIGGLVEHNGGSLNHKGLFVCPDVIRPCLCLLHGLVPRFPVVDIVPLCLPSHSSGIANACPRLPLPAGQADGGLR